VEITPRPSVAATAEKANAIPWKSVAHEAARAALRSAGEADGLLRLRQDRHEGDRRWAAFDVPVTGDVVWVAQVDGTAPPGSFAVMTHVGEVGVWRHPNDPALPGLPIAVTPGGTGAVVAAVAPDVDPTTVEVVALHPLERAVIRVGAPGNAVYVKVVPPWRTGAVADRHRRVRAVGVPSPSVLAVDEVRGWLVLSELEGVPLAEHLETGWPLPRADDVWQVIHTWVGAGLLHGDLHDRQLLVNEHGDIVGVVDFDDAGAGDLVDDLGRFVAHVSWRGVTHPEQASRIGPWVDELVAVFARHVDPVALRRRTARATDRLRRLSRT